MKGKRQSASRWGRPAGLPPFPFRPANPCSLHHKSERRFARSKYGAARNAALPVRDKRLANGIPAGHYQHVKYRARSPEPIRVPRRALLHRLPTLAMLALTALLTCSAERMTAAPADLSWPTISREQRPWAYWWWLASAVDQTNLTRELTRYRDAGIGGVHIIPIYGARGYETNFIPYLTPRWMEMLRYTCSEAERLGLGVDMTTGSGWCFGGPRITDEEANASVVTNKAEVAPGAKLEGTFIPQNHPGADGLWAEGQKAGSAAATKQRRFGQLESGRWPLAGIRHFPKAIGPEGQTRRPGRRRSHVEPVLSASNDQLSPMV